MTALTSNLSTTSRAETRAGLLWGRVLVIACFAIPLLMDAFGQAPYYGFIYNLYPWTTVAALCITAFLLLLLVVTPDRQVFREFGGAWGRRAIMLLCFWTIPFGFKLLGGRPSLPILILFGVFFVFYVGITIWNPRSLLWFFALALAYASIMRLRFIHALPVFSGLSDMLPLVVKASGRFLAGQQPYAETYSMPHILPLTYLPATWLSYVPAVALGLDVRIINLLCTAGSVILLLSLVVPLRHRPETNVAIGYAALLLLLPTSMLYDSFTTHQIAWFWILLTLRLLLARRLFLAGLAAGVLLAASQVALVAVPVLVFYVWRAFGFKQLLLASLATLGVVALFIAPFALWNPRAFFNAVFVFFGDLSGMSTTQWNKDHHWLFVLGFTAEAWRLGWQDNLKYIQAFLVLALAGVFALKYRATAVNLFRFVILSFGFFLLFSAVVALHYHLIWLWIVAFYLAIFSIPETTSKLILHPRRSQQRNI